MARPLHFPHCSSRLWSDPVGVRQLNLNLTWQILASYPVFRTKWREISCIIFCGKIFLSPSFLAHEVCTNHEYKDFLRPRAEAGSHRCCPSTNTQNLGGGAQLFPRHTTCPRSHELLVSRRGGRSPSTNVPVAASIAWAAQQEWESIKKMR